MISKNRCASKARAKPAQGRLLRKTVFRRCASQFQVVKDEEGDHVLLLIVANVEDLPYAGETTHVFPWLEPQVVFVALLHLDGPVPEVAKPDFEIMRRAVNLVADAELDSELKVVRPDPVFVAQPLADLMALGNHVQEMLTLRIFLLHACETKPRLGLDEYIALGVRRQHCPDSNCDEKTKHGPLKQQTLEQQGRVKHCDLQVK